MDKIEGERRRQASVLESKRAQLQGGSRARELHTTRVRLAAMLRIAHLVARKRLQRRAKAAAAPKPVAHPPAGARKPQQKQAASRQAVSPVPPTAPNVSSTLISFPLFFPSRTCS